MLDSASARNWPSSASYVWPMFDSGSAFIHSAALAASENASSGSAGDVGSVTSAASAASCVSTAVSCMASLQRLPDAPAGSRAGDATKLHESPARGELSRHRRNFMLIA